MKKRKKKILTFSFLVLLILILAGSYYSYISEGIIYSIATNDTDYVVNYINSFGSLAALILILLVILEVVAAPIPHLILYVVSGILFGTFLGGFLVLAGNLIGAALAFIIARTIAREYISKKIEGKNKRRFDKLSEKYGAFAIFFLRINPITSSDIFSYLAGLSKMKLSHFLIGTALGLAPLVFIQTYLGADIIKNNPILFLIFIAASLAYFIIFIYLIIHFILKKKK
ncbi:MAG: VTT domain-containing protein [Nanoarchaeota archaeon]|nr:VTT domain-containing protein [Nanoarchaeota archaeon]MBU1051234.1 VTT domain-containing protein [Nanoarchaeota archaeon]MBU1988544.1 VTT domain-containing protein [Nanoarchaeota archaeon]